MAEFLVGVVIFIVRAVDFVLDIAMSTARLKRVAASVTGADRIVRVPADPKVLPAAAERALAEAEARHRDRASFIDKYVTPSCN